MIVVLHVSLQRGLCKICVIPVFLNHPLITALPHSDHLLISGPERLNQSPSLALALGHVCSLLKFHQAAT